MYRLTSAAGMVQHIDSGTAFPASDASNELSRLYQEWLAQGNEPEAAPAPVVPRVPCTPLYCQREILTAGELDALINLAMTNAAANKWWTQFNVASAVLPTDPQLAPGLAFMVQAGVFSPSRVDAIVAAIAAQMPWNWGAT